MEWIIKQLATAAKVITWLNLKKVFLLALVSLCAILLFAGYENRVRIVEEVGGQAKVTAKFKVSADLQDRIKTYVNSSSLITTMTVLSADLKINERDIVYRYSDSAVLNELWEKKFRETGTARPIFTKDTQNNSQMVSVVNGEFSCTPYAETVNAGIVPEAAKLTPVICRVSLPPYYGEFSGYITLSLVKVPTDAERGELQLEAKRIANEIFFKNVVRK